MNDKQMWDALVARGYPLVWIDDIMGDPTDRERMRKSLQSGRTSAPTDPDVHGDYGQFIGTPGHRGLFGKLVPSDQRQAYSERDEDSRWTEGSAENVAALEKALEAKGLDPDLINRIVRMGEEPPAGSEASRVVRGQLRATQNMSAVKEVFDDGFVRSLLVSVGLGRLGVDDKGFSWNEENKGHLQGTGWATEPTPDGVADEVDDEEKAAAEWLAGSVGNLGQYLAAAGVYGLTATEIDYQSIWETIVSEYGDELGPGFMVRPEDADGIMGEFGAKKAYQQMIESLAMAGVNEEMIVNSMSMWAQGVGQWKGPNDQRVERVQEISGLNAAQSRQIVSEAERRGINVDLYARAAASVSRMGVHRYSAVAPSVLGISGDELQDVTEEPLVIGEARRRRAGGERRGSEVSRAIRPTSQGGEGLPLGQLSISRIGAGLVEQLSAFTSEASAIMALVDPALAAAFQNDPWGRSMQELERALEILGPDAEKDPRLAAETDWLWTRIRGGFQNTTKTVDTGTIREAARSLAAAWNLPDLTDGYLDSLASSYAAQYGMSLSDLYGNPFQDDPLAIPGQRTRTVQGADAMAADRLRGTAGYQDLFGNKTDGESEEQYVGRFEQMANFEFGPGYDGSTESVRAGMRSGESQDVRGHGMATGEAFDSMTFQERLHGLAAAFKAVT